MNKEKVQQYISCIRTALDCLEAGIETKEYQVEAKFLSGWACSINDGLDGVTFSTPEEADKAIKKYGSSDIQYRVTGCSGTSGRKEWQRYCSGIRSRTK